MASKTLSLSKVVSHEEWRKAHDEFLAKEKAATRARDALAAERRRLPMERIEKTYTFEGANGPVTLLDLFENRPQLLLYHFMFAEGVSGWPNAGCPGCSMFMDNLGQFARTHIAHRDTSFAVVSRGPIENLSAYKKRMSWNATWVSSAKNTFNVDFGLTTERGEDHGLSVFVRDGNEIYRTYFTAHRGLETLSTVWSLLDITPLGRQETWEDSPEGRPQAAPYEWWRRHDEYEKQ